MCAQWRRSVRKRWEQVGDGGTARRDGARRGRSDAVVREEEDGRGEGMTGGLHPSAREVSVGVGWVASGGRWAWPLGFPSSDFFSTG